MSIKLEVHHNMRVFRTTDPTWDEGLAVSGPVPKPISVVPVVSKPSSQKLPVESPLQHQPPRLLYHTGLSGEHHLPFLF